MATLHDRPRLLIFLAALALSLAAGAWLYLLRPLPPRPAPLEVHADAAAAGPGMAVNDADDLTPIPGDLLVEAHHDHVAAIEQDLHATLPDARVEIGPWSHMGPEDMLEVRVAPGQEGAAAARLRTEAGVDSVEHDYTMHAYRAPVREPDDPLYPYLWNMRKVGAVGAWRGSTGQGVVVAVIDTGVAYEDYKNFHRVEDMLPETFVPGYNALNDTDHANDDNCHGTHVAATIAEATHNQVGAIGLAYDCRIMPIKVLSASGSGSIGAIANGIRFAADHGANVINMSLGGPIGIQALKDACAYAYSKGVVIVCAAGNSSSKNCGYPANYDTCVAVSATRDDNRLTWYSNRGKRIDIAAPGGDLTVDQNNDGYMDGILQNTIERGNPAKDGYYLFQGTSMASPHVAAAAALIEALGITNPAVVKSILQQGANRKDVPEDLSIGYGAGVLDANHAVMHAIIGTGVAQLLIGAVLLGVALRLGRRGDYARLTPFTLLGLMVAASGCFFLPYLMDQEIPWSDLLCRPVAAWDLHFLGLAGHGNPLFYSALLPLLLSLVLDRRLGIVQQALTGFSAGYGACLLHLALSEQTTVKWIPSFLQLPTIWLIVNAALCVFIAVGLADARRRRRSG